MGSARFSADRSRFRRWSNANAGFPAGIWVGVYPSSRFVNAAPLGRICPPAAILFVGRDTAKCQKKQLQYTIYAGHRNILHYAHELEAQYPWPHYARALGGVPVGAAVRLVTGASGLPASAILACGCFVFRFCGLGSGVSRSRSLRGDGREFSRIKLLEEDQGGGLPELERLHQVRCAISDRTASARSDGSYRHSHLRHTESVWMGGYWRIASARTVARSPESESVAAECSPNAATAVGFRGCGGSRSCNGGDRTRAALGELARRRVPVTGEHRGPMAILCWRVSEGLAVQLYGMDLFLGQSDRAKRQGDISEIRTGVLL